MKRLLAQIEQVAQTDATVLIEGETGSGKELMAQAVHRLSARKDRPPITVNCASLPPTLIESELISLPIQFNYDSDIGPTDDGRKIFPNDRVSVIEMTRPSGYTKNTCRGNKCRKGK